MLTKESILAAADLPIEPVDVPEWGGTLYVRTLSGAERDAFESSTIDAKKSGAVLDNIRARLAVRALCDKDGNRLFADDDADALGRKSGKALDRIWDVAQRLSGMGKGDVEAAEKN
jgi:hypothetical protein